MCTQIFQTIYMYFVCIYAFEEIIHVYGQANQEMMEHGRIQYQLLRERSNLPHYGQCWKAAVEHLDEECKYLSEETQSDIALHITNCFLEMSGHETYNCEFDKKPNLRRICISSMSDRAFNVYTEFYTHTQNMCWFLRGQIWYETISENTLKVGRQLKLTAQNQEGLLQAQKESLELQEKMLKQGKFLEIVLEDLYVSSKQHKDILMLLSQSINNFHSWLIGEVSWIDSIIFYIMLTAITFLLTSSQRTGTARVPLFLLFLLNFFMERIICSTVISSKESNKVIYADIYNFIWFTRYGFLFVAIFILIYKALTHKDLLIKNYELLHIIKEQNDVVVRLLKPLKLDLNKSEVSVIDENVSNYQNISSNWKHELINNCSKGSYDNNLDCKYSPLNIYTANGIVQETLSIKNNIKNKKMPSNILQNRYNLRNNSSRQGTPEC